MYDVQSVSILKMNGIGDQYRREKRELKFLLKNLERPREALTTKKTKKTQHR